VPGTRGKTSAAPRFIAAVEAHAAASKLSLRHDDPYKGGFSTQHYGRPSANVHAVQVELARRLYMDERSCALEPRSFGLLRTWCAGLVAALGNA
jgi:N-formylglutamate amidohydrolase